MRKVLAAAFVVVFVVSGCSMESFSDADRASDPERTPIPRATDAAPHSELAEVVEEALPSVVNVKVDESIDPARGGGEGSGVVIDESGIILTNYHVVEGALEVRVVFTDNREPLEGQVIGGDIDKDLAVIQVDADDLEAIPVGSSSSMKLGDDVVAIGFPLGLGGPTVTSGILSGTNREIQARAGTQVETLYGLIQTDAAINPGNSGGPLLDHEGRLIGINTAVAGLAENIGFAIPIDDALPIINEILTEPPEQRAWLGVQTVDITSPVVAEELGVPADLRGAVVVTVIADSPAAESDLTEGDVIVAVEDEPIRSSDDLITVLAGLDPGTPVDITVVSADGERTITVELAQRPLTLDTRTPEDEE